jgi:hypothetical protein
MKKRNGWMVMAAIGAVLLTVCGCASFAPDPLGGWKVLPFSNAPDVYYMVYDRTMISEQDGKDYSEITDFMFSEDGLSFVTSKIPYAMRGFVVSFGTLTGQVDFDATYSPFDPNPYETTYKISIKYSAKLEQFLAELTEPRYTPITVVGYDGKFKFYFPNKFDEVYQLLKEKQTASAQTE